ncbi:hypothetical protein MUK42_35753 [Musa troglodytarum]|uniref:Uncharacterized protein n=1 Tax=Musa troglodytarum TaxID=320322 RepID=A0A9E7KH97_9LILI|nr:hypothetical protein MUK42_35753 [Musa troglodytarum]
MIAVEPQKVYGKDNFFNYIYSIILVSDPDKSFSFV